MNWNSVIDAVPPQQLAHRTSAALRSLTILVGPVVCGDVGPPRTTTNIHFHVEGTREDAVIALRDADAVLRALSAVVGVPSVDVYVSWGEVDEYGRPEEIQLGDPDDFFTYIWPELSEPERDAWLAKL